MGVSSYKKVSGKKELEILKMKEIKSNSNIWNTVKSSYILNEIFSFLNAKRKLNIIINNNQIKKKLRINIEDYKKISGKYKVGKRNGKVSVYILNTNILIFEGEYLNGKRNGKGKEYNYNGELIFDGEYLNGEKWNGKGKEYYADGIIKFEGEYSNGKWNGKGKEFFNNN